MRWGTITVLALCLAWGASLTPRDASAQGMTLKQSFEVQNQKLSDFLLRGDAAGIAGLYTTKAMILPPNAEIVSGRAEIEKHWKAAIGAGLKRLRITTVEVEGRIDKGTELATWEVLGDADQVLDHGKSIVIWKVEQGAWRRYRDIWNSSMPAAAVAGKKK